MKPKILLQEFEAAFDSLLTSYPVQAHSSIQKDKSKYYEELLALVESLPDKNLGTSSLQILDVGGGAGNLCILIKHLLGCQVSMVDRLDEFADEHERVMGNTQDVVSRLHAAEIQFLNIDPFVNSYFEDQKFDIILNFDVIEHLPHGVPKFIEKMYNLLTPQGILIISTPNQVHLKNRLKCLCGQNTWEDFDYYITTDHFFGHIRELTYSEFDFLLRKYQNYEIKGRTHQLNHYSRYYNLYEKIKPILKFIVDRNPKFSYQLFGFLRKCD
jgi:2-polyprenyl-3-methyl-5-hydroxy-6-metoxy-1,4-benzoquinol methylase